jgi:CarD family transcriptional regulator
MAKVNTAKNKKKTAKPAAKKTVKKASAKPVKKVVASKSAKTKVVAKKVVAKKAPAKKLAIKKPAPKKPAAKKPVVKAPAAKVSVKKPTKGKVVAKVSKAVAVKPATKVVERQPARAVQMAEMKTVVRPSMPVQRPMLVNKSPHRITVPPQANTKKGAYAVGEYVVYPTHGVGKIVGMEVETIGEYQLKVFVIMFEKDKMTLRVPVGRAEAAGLRSVSSNDQITRAITTLKGRAKIARGMWSRRAQEYETKINSGNLVAIAEVVRDLHKNVDQSERSYSERMIYETAMHRLVGEVAAAESLDVKLAHDRLLKVLRKQAAA